MTEIHAMATPDDPLDPWEEADRFEELLEEDDQDELAFEDEDPTPTGEDDPIGVEPGELAGIRVLVLERDPADLKMLRGGLDYLGCESTVASSPDQALERLAARPHRVVLADVSMPGMQGAATVDAFHRAARAADPAGGSPLGVVAVTGRATHDEADAWRAAGFDDHLARPVRLERLAQVLREWGAEDGDSPGSGEPVEITREPDLAPEEEARVHLHTFLNILNLVSGQLRLLRRHLGPGAMAATTARVDELLDGVRGGSLDETLVAHPAELEETLRKEAGAALDGAEEDDRAAAREILDNLASILAVLRTRAAEHAARRMGGLEWRDHSARALSEDLTGFLDAVQRNARERYHIVPDPAAQEPGDYLVRLTVRGGEGDTLRMPPILTDVLRDLVANARKYTPPGGALSAELVQDGGELRMVVEDSGVGIPPGEVERVVEMGYRATNVRDRDSWGGGFGLTKAWLATRRLGGRLWIDSAPGRGTRVTLRIPVPEGS